MSKLKHAISDMQSELDRLTQVTKYHRERIGYHHDVVRKLEGETSALALAIRYVNRLEESLPEDGAVEITEVPEETPEETFPVPAAPANGAVEPKANGFDRIAVSYALHRLKVRHPLPRCYWSSSRLERQAIIRACVEHPDYHAYVAGGGFELNDPYHRTVPCVDAAVKALGVDVKPIIEEARKLHAQIYTHGQPGVDYAV